MSAMHMNPGVCLPPLMCVYGHKMALNNHRTSAREESGNEGMQQAGEELGINDMLIQQLFV